MIFSHEDGMALRADKQQIQEALRLTTDLIMRHAQLKFRPGEAGSYIEPPLFAQNCHLRLCQYNCRLLIEQIDKIIIQFQHCVSGIQISVTGVAGPHTHSMV